MKKNIQESLDKIKYLTEYHFKPSSRDSVSSFSDETPVKFNEVGDVYKQEEEVDDYPAFESYRNSVILDEDDPEDQNQQPNVPNTEPQQPAGEFAPSGQEQPAASPQTPPVTNPPMGQEPAAQPAPAPEQPMTMPAAQPDASLEGGDSDILAKLDMQTAKTEEMLAKFDQMQMQLASMQGVSTKLDDVKKEIDDLKNPPYEDQLEMISKQSYPYNIKLSDFWGWDKDDDKTEEPVDFKLNPGDLESYNKDEIKNSFS